jgi:hypothetical protein
MNKFEIKKHNYADEENPVSVYVNCSTSTVNPFEIEKDIEEFIYYMREKYKIKSTNLSFKKWLKQNLTYKNNEKNI